MTRHNATWTEETYYQDDEITGQDQDPESEDHGKSGYWDYRDNE